MLILIISDIHANLTALETVLQAAGEFDAVWCLGDLVGYGPDPNECIACIRDLPNLVCILGNHDAAALGLIDVNEFNPEARTSLLWTKKVLIEKNLKFLHNLPDILVLEEVTLTHGSPRQPIWEYLMDIYTATQNFDHFLTPYCFVGHTHYPSLFRMNQRDHFARLELLDPENSFTLPVRSIINPGSVGQPRDRDPRTSFALFNSETRSWHYRRIEYDIQSVQERMLSAELPMRHILRLTDGW